MKEVRVTYNERTNCVILTEDGISSGYEIDLDTIKDEAALQDWIGHLLGKNWITQKALEKFIEIAIRGIEI